MQKHIPELDGLRGLGAMMVVAYHWDPTYIFWSWCWVPMFFVLSGFLISRLMFDDILDGRFSLRNFYVRRILRIWPVYYAALVTILVYYLLTTGFGFFGGPFFTDWLQSLVYLQFTELYFTELNNPNAIFYFLPGMLPVWTLAVEEQFYLLLPLALMFLVPRIGLKRLAWGLVLLAFLGPVMRFAGFAPTLLLTQIDSLALGVLLGCMTTRQARAGNGAGGVWHTRLYLASIVIALVAMAPYVIRGYQVTPGPQELFSDPFLWTEAGLFFFGVIGLISMYPRNRISAFLRSRPLVYAGSISYALYVFHMPLLTFVEPRVMRLVGEQYHWLGVILMILILVGLPHLSRELLERPVLRLKRRFPQDVEGG